MKRIVEYFNEDAKVHDERFIRQLGMTELYDQVETQLNRCAQKGDILILGCGTGLEIERIQFETAVTAVDISPEMIKQLQKKKFYPGIRLNTICASFLDYDFGNEKYDIVLTCYTLHHFSIAQKRALFHRIHQCLKKGGAFINGDMLSESIEEQTEKMDEAEKVYSSENMPFASLHIDVPLTFENEAALLKEAGFQTASLEKAWGKSGLYRCMK